MADQITTPEHHVEERSLALVSGAVSHLVFDPDGLGHELGELPEESMQHTCSSALEVTTSWCCQQEWSHSPPSQLSVLLALPSAFCFCGCWSKSGSTNSCSATKPALVPSFCCARGASAEKEAGRDAWLGRDLSSSISLELLQKPLMLYPQASSHHPPTAVTTLPKLPEYTLERRAGHMDQLGFPGAQGHAGDRSHFLPGPEEFKGWAPYPAQQDEPCLHSPIMIMWGNPYMGLLFTVEGCPYHSVALKKLPA